MASSKGSSKDPRPGERRSGGPGAPTPLSSLLRLPPGDVDLSRLATDAMPGLPPQIARLSGSKRKGAAAALAAADGSRLSDLQEMLWAEGRTGGHRSVLLVLQGMDTAGKGGTVNHVVGEVAPIGVRYVAFGKPTEEELQHDFLWRIRRGLPAPGQLGVFDRSHYEDVLVVRVHELVPEDQWRGRYSQINDFEAQLVEAGTVVVKCFLHISKDEQRERLLARLDRKDKLWKFNPGDVDERLRWDDYQAAYADALRECNTEVAPWYVVPGDRKWYRNWAVGRLLLEALQGMGLVWPAPDFDPEAQRRRLLET
ncbi:MAG: PPK2 family polyphosphate kinase [Actinomycetes bacterium]